MDEHQVPLSTQVAERLAAAILAGEFEAGQRLDEVSLGERLGVSRNTLREAFRVLGHDQLVEHLPNRGVFVRRVGQREAAELFAVRRQLELGALDELGLMVLAGREPEAWAREALVDSIRAAESARDRDDWVAVGTANARFHLGLVDLSGNQVAARLVRGIIALTRVRYLTLGDPRSIHEDFVDENHRIADLVLARQFGRARAALEVYLLRAEDRLA